MSVTRHEVTSVAAPVGVGWWQGDGVYASGAMIAVDALADFNRSRCYSYANGDR